jgi:hypothetical protein
MEYVRCRLKKTIKHTATDSERVPGEERRFNTARRAQGNEHTAKADIDDRRAQQQHY